MDSHFEWTLAGQPGGKAGSLQPKPPAVGAPGKPGTVTHTNSTTLTREQQAIEIAEINSELWATMNLHAAESDYANGEIEAASERLHWLLELLSSQGILQSEDDIGNTSMNTSALQARVTGLLKQLEMGMDYFGHSEDFAPALSVDYYENRLAVLVDYAMEFEKLHSEFVGARDNTRHQIGLLRRAIEEKRIVIEATRAAASANLDLVKRLDDEIVEMAGVIARLQLRCIELAAEFQSDVAEATNGCSLAEAISVVGSIATAVVTIKTGGLAAAGAATQLWELGRIKETGFSDSVEAMGDRLKLIGKVGKGVGAVAKGYAEITKALDRDPTEVPHVPTDDNFDSAKLLQSRADLDEMLDPFRHRFASAKELSQTFDQFVETAVSRNNKLIEGLHARAQAAAEYAKADIAEQEIEDLRQLSSAPKASSFWYFSEFFEQSLRDNIEALAFYYYQLSQAVDWWSGNALNEEFMGPTPLWYRQRLLQTRQRIDLELEKRREDQIGSLDDKYDDYSLLETFGPAAVASLVEDGSCIVQLPIDLVTRTRRFVRATSVKISLVGAGIKPSIRDDDPLRLTVSAIGVGQLVNKNDDIMRRHFPRRDTNYTIHVSDWSGRPTSLGGSGRFSEPPLAGLWRLNFPVEDHERISFGKDFDMRIQFETTFLPA